MILAIRDMGAEYCDVDIPVFNMNVKEITFYRIQRIHIWNMAK